MKTSWVGLYINGCSFLGELNAWRIEKISEITKCSQIAKKDRALNFDQRGVLDFSNSSYWLRNQHLKILLSFEKSVISCYLAVIYSE